MSDIRIAKETAVVWKTLTDVPRADRSIERFQYQRIYDSEGSAGLSAGTKTTCKYNLTPSGDYMVLGAAYLHARFQVVRAPGGVEAPLNAGEKITVCANPALLFQETKLYINNKQIEQHDYPGIKSQIEYLSRGSSVLKKTYESEGWIPDTGAGAWVNDESILVHPAAASDADPVTAGDLNAAINGTLEESSIRPNPNFNEGIYRREYRTGGSHWVEYRIPIARLFSFVRENPTLPLTGVPITIELRLASRDHYAQFILNDTPDGGFVPGRVKVDTLDLWVPNVTPDSETNAKLLSMFVEGRKLELLYNHSSLYVSPEIGGTQNSLRWDVTLLRTPPSFVYVVFGPPVASGLLEVVQRRNPCLFDNMDMKRMWVTLDNVQFPQELYSIEFNVDDDPAIKHEYMRLYNDFLAASAMCSDDLCQESVVSYEDFKKLYPVFAFDLQHIDVSRFDVSSTHQLRLACEFGQDKVDEVRHAFVLVSAERSAVCSFTGDRRMLVDFGVDS